MRLDTAASAIAVTLDATFIRTCADGERPPQVRVGNVETASGSRQVFGAAAKSGTPIAELIRRSLDAVGRTGDRGSGSNRTESAFQLAPPIQQADFVRLMQKTYL